MVDDTVHTATYAIIGELVMMANAIDHLLNQLVISVFGLERTPMLEPIIATLDPRQKIEMIKARYKIIPTLEWRKALERFCATVSRFTGKEILLATHQPHSRTTHGNLRQ